MTPECASKRPALGWLSANEDRAVIAATLSGRDLHHRKGKLVIVRSIDELQSFKSLPKFYPFPDQG